MYELPTNRCGYRFPPFGSNKLGYLFGPCFLGSFTAITDEYPSGFNDDKVSAFKMSGSRILPNRNVVFLIELDGECCFPDRT